MSSRQITVSTLWQIASQAVMACLSAASVKFVAIGLSKELAGSYNSAYGYLQLFAILADFGLYAVSIREVSTAKNREQVLGALLVLRCVITVLSLGAGLLIAWSVSAWQDTPLRFGIMIASFVPFFTLLAGVLRTTFQVTYTMHYVFVAEVLQRVLTTGLMAILIAMGVRGSTDLIVYQLFLWVGVAGAFLLFLLSLFFSVRLMPLRPCFDRAILTKLLRHAAPYGIAYLCIALYRQFDLTMIALLRPDYELQNAEYGFAQRISEMTFLVPTFLLNSTLPLLSERHERGDTTDALLGRTLLMIVLIVGVSALFCSLWSRPLMQLLTTEEYLSSAHHPTGSDTALRLLSIPMVLNGFVLFSFYVLLTKHRWKPLVATMLVGVIVSIVSNLALIPSYGFTGAIMTSAIVHGFLACLLYPIALKTLPIRVGKGNILRSLAFFLIVALVLFLVRPFLTTMPSILIGSAIGGLSVVFVAYVCGIFRLARGE